MVFWLCCLTGILTFIIFILIIKICLLKKSADEIADGFAGRAASDTNTLIGISSCDRHMRKLADTINKELLLLQDDRRRFQQGDKDLKNAVTNISHDLRTPLTAICGYLDLLDREETSDTVSRYLKIIRGRTEICAISRKSFSVIRYIPAFPAGPPMSRSFSTAVWRTASPPFMPH